MLSIPQPPANASRTKSASVSEGKPVVDLPEESQTLDRLLRLCYPVRAPVLDNLSDIHSILSAAMKYEMDAATALMREKLVTFIEYKPYHVWALACTLELEEEALQAAKACSNVPCPQKLPDVFKAVTAGEYFRLRKFLRSGACGRSNFKFWERHPEDVRGPVDAEGLGYTTTSLKLVERPFADLICRANDGVEFKTHKIILAASSPSLLQRIQELPAPKDKRTLPVLPLDSRSEDLEPMLELLYPGSLSRHAQMGELRLPPDRLLALAKCAIKYEVTFVNDELLSRWKKTVDVEPMLAYLLAARLDLKRYIQIAKNALQHRPRSDDQWVPEMESMPASVYHALYLPSCASDRDDDEPPRKWRRILDGTLSGYARMRPV